MKQSTPKQITAETFFNKVGIPIIKPINSNTKLPNCDIVFKRQFRYTFEFAIDNNTVTDQQFVKYVTLPKLTVDKNLKPKWSQLIVKYFDVAGQNKELWHWILLGCGHGMQTVGTVEYWDASGILQEQIVMQISPKEVVFSDLDYSSSAEADITITFDVSSIERIVPENDISNNNEINMCCKMDKKEDEDKKECCCGCGGLYGKCRVP